MRHPLSRRDLLLGTFRLDGLPALFLPTPRRQQNGLESLGHRPPEYVANTTQRQGAVHPGLQNVRSEQVGKWGAEWPDDHRRAVGGIFID